MYAEQSNRSFLGCFKERQTDCGSLRKKYTYEALGSGNGTGIMGLGITDWPTTSYQSYRLHVLSVWD